MTDFIKQHPLSSVLLAALLAFAVGANLPQSSASAPPKKVASSSIPKDAKSLIEDFLERHGHPDLMVYEVSRHYENKEHKIYKVSCYPEKKLDPVTLWLKFSPSDLMISKDTPPESSPTPKSKADQAYWANKCEWNAAMLALHCLLKVSGVPETLPYKATCQTDYGKNQEGKGVITKHVFTIYADEFKGPKSRRAKFLLEITREGKAIVKRLSSEAEFK